MIFNERQYNITKKQIRKFELKIAELQQLVLPNDKSQQIRHKTHLNALNSQLEELRAEVEEYKNLKQGNIKLLLNSFSAIAHFIFSRCGKNE